MLGVRGRTVERWSKSVEVIVKNPSRTDTIQETDREARDSGDEGRGCTLVGYYLENKSHEVYKQM